MRHLVYTHKVIALLEILSLSVEERVFGIAGKKYRKADVVALPERIVKVKEGRYIKFAGVAVVVVIALHAACRTGFVCP